MKSKWDLNEDDIEFIEGDSSKSEEKGLIPGGQAEGMDPSKFDPEQLTRGTRHEMEHTNDVMVAREIAMDHLVEDSDYYRKLEQVEKGLHVRAGITGDVRSDPKANITGDLKGGGLLNRRVKRAIKFPKVQAKAIRKGTCSQGERADLTGCTPASDEPTVKKDTNEADSQVSQSQESPGEPEKPSGQGMLAEWRHR